MARVKLYDQILLQRKLEISAQFCAREEEENNRINQLLSFFSGLPVCFLASTYPIQIAVI